MSKSKFVALLSILNNLPKDVALTAQEIFDELEPADRGTMKNAGTISATLGGFRKQKIVENGESEYVGGQSVLTWKLTNKGRESCKMLKAEITRNTPVVESETVPKEEAIGIDSADEWQESKTTVTEDQLREELAENNVMVTDGVDNLVKSSEDSVIGEATEALLGDVETLCGKFTDHILLMKQEVDVVLAENISLKKQNDDLIASKRVIARKELKIDTLQRLAVLMHSDIAEVLEDVLNDYRAA
jgi:hypothetical protein